MQIGRWLFAGIAGLALFLAGFWLGRSPTGESIRELGLEAAGRVGAVVAQRAGTDTRSRLILENPDLYRRVQGGGAFGGTFSRHVAQNMFGQTDEAIADANELTEVEELAPRTWLVRFPIVNCVLFETDEGLVVVDTGMSPAGPALVEAIRSISALPVHTVIYTHGHVDHAYGTWALLEAGWNPEVIAHAAIEERFDRYIRLRGSMAKYMSQPEHQLPASREDLVWPTRTFDDRLEIEVGGETFVLQHHRGETDDQLYVWAPARRALATADYYQGFLPNAGNGKRVQRHPEEWAFALREMAALEPALLLPAHGEALTDPSLIQENLGVHAEVLEFVVKHTIDGLNAGLRKDQIFQSLELPRHLDEHPTLRVQYVTARDISKMVIRQYTGWWDDIPSHWSPAPLEHEAQAIVESAGGMDAFVDRTREYLATDVILASHFADWAWLAEPENAAVQQLVLDVYRERILDPRSNTQDMLAYLDAMALARDAQLAAGTP
ncbi:MAG: MBL fold metallo-hydrolase [Myxococcota bacterium]